MEKDWTLVYTVNKSYQAELCLEVLEESKITGVVINKKDTSYASLGEYEVYVPADVAETAKALLQKTEL